MNRTMQGIFVGLTIMLLFGLATGGTSELQLRPPTTQSDLEAPDGDTSRLLSYAVANDDLRMASASDDCSPALQES